ncbi:unnamed protein product [Amoebophrya sp. A120]|nr:unnamed protein product [Amoebophrya sp. A120]|eukprot:GSA120T00023770001.1
MTAFTTPGLAAEGNHYHPRPTGPPATTAHPHPNVWLPPPQLSTSTQAGGSSSSSSTSAQVTKPHYMFYNEKLNYRMKPLRVKNSSTNVVLAPEDDAFDFYRELPQSSSKGSTGGYSQQEVDIASNHSSRRGLDQLHDHDPANRTKIPRPVQVSNATSNPSAGWLMEDFDEFQAEELLERQATTMGTSISTGKNYNGNHINASHDMSLVQDQHPHDNYFDEEILNYNRQQDTFMFDQTHPFLEEEMAEVEDEMNFLTPYERFLSGGPLLGTMPIRAPSLPVMQPLVPGLVVSGGMSPAALTGHSRSFAGSPKPITLDVDLEGLRSVPFSLVPPREFLLEQSRLAGVFEKLNRGLFRSAARNKLEALRSCFHDWRLQKLYLEPLLQKNRQAANRFEVIIENRERERTAIVHKVKQTKGLTKQELTHRLFGVEQDFHEKILTVRRQLDFLAEKKQYLLGASHLGGKVLGKLFRERKLQAFLHWQDNTSGKSDALLSYCCKGRNGFFFQPELKKREEQLALHARRKAEYLAREKRAVHVKKQLPVLVNTLQSVTSRVTANTYWRWRHALLHYPNANSNTKMKEPRSRINTEQVDDDETHSKQKSKSPASSTRAVRTKAAILWKKGAGAAVRSSRTDFMPADISGESTAKISSTSSQVPASGADPGTFPRGAEGGSCNKSKEDAQESSAAAKQEPPAAAPPLSPNRYLQNQQKGGSSSSSATSWWHTALEGIKHLASASMIQSSPGLPPLPGMNSPDSAGHAKVKEKDDFEEDQAQHNSQQQHSVSEVISSALGRSPVKQEPEDSPVELSVKTSGLEQLAGGNVAASASEEKLQEVVDGSISRISDKLASPVESSNGATSTARRSGGETAAGLFPRQPGDDPDLADFVQKTNNGLDTDLYLAAHADSKEYKNLGGVLSSSVPISSSSPGEDSTSPPPVKIENQFLFHQDSKGEMSDGTSMRSRSEQMNYLASKSSLANSTSNADSPGTRARKHVGFSGRQPSQYSYTHAYTAADFYDENDLDEEEFTEDVDLPPAASGRPSSAHQNHNAYFHADYLEEEDSLEEELLGSCISLDHDAPARPHSATEAANLLNQDHQKLRQKRVVPDPSPPAESSTRSASASASLKPGLPKTSKDSSTYIPFGNTKLLATPQSTSVADEEYHLKSFSGGVMNNSNPDTEFLFAKNTSGLLNNSSGGFRFSDMNKASPISSINSFSARDDPEELEFDHVGRPVPGSSTFTSDAGSKGSTSHQSNQNSNRNHSRHGVAKLMQFQKKKSREELQEPAYAGREFDDEKLLLRKTNSTSFVQLASPPVSPLPQLLSSPESSGSQSGRGGGPYLPGGSQSASSRGIRNARSSVAVKKTSNDGGSSSMNYVSKVSSSSRNANAATSSSASGGNKAKARNASPNTSSTRPSVSIKRLEVKETQRLLESPSGSKLLNPALPAKRNSPDEIYYADPDPFYRLRSGGEDDQIQGSGGARTISSGTTSQHRTISAASTAFDSSTHPAYSKESAAMNRVRSSASTKPPLIHRPAEQYRNGEVVDKSGSSSTSSTNRIGSNDLDRTIPNGVQSVSLGLLTEGAAANRDSTSSATTNELLHGAVNSGATAVSNAISSMRNPSLRIEEEFELQSHPKSSSSGTTALLQSAVEIRNFPCFNAVYRQEENEMWAEKPVYRSEDNLIYWNEDYSMWWLGRDPETMDDLSFLQEMLVVFSTEVDCGASTTQRSSTSTAERAPFLQGILKEIAASKNKVKTARTSSAGGASTPKSVVSGAEGEEKTNSSITSADLQEYLSSAAAESSKVVQYLRQVFQAGLLLEESVLLVGRTGEEQETDRVRTGQERALVELDAPEKRIYFLRNADADLSLISLDFNGSDEPSDGPRRLADVFGKEVVRKCEIRVGAGGGVE